VSVDESERQALINEAQAWREAAAACAPDSPERLKFRNKMKRAEWKLHTLGPPQYPPGIVIKINVPEQSEELRRGIEARTLYRRRTSAILATAKVMHCSQMEQRSPTRSRSLLPASPQKLHVTGLADFDSPLRLSCMYMR